MTPTQLCTFLLQSSFSMLFLVNLALGNVTKPFKYAELALARVFKKSYRRLLSIKYIYSRNCFTMSHRNANDQDILPLTDPTEIPQRIMVYLLRSAITTLVNIKYYMRSGSFDCESFQAADRNKAICAILHGLKSVFRY